MSDDKDEMLLRLLHEYQTLCAACQVVYEEELNQRVDATPPSVKRAIRKMVQTMESSTTPGRRKFHRVVGVS